VDAAVGLVDLGRCNECTMQEGGVRSEGWDDSLGIKFFLAAGCKTSDA
jgi:hypothetical protein